MDGKHLNSRIIYKHEMIHSKCFFAVYKTTPGMSGSDLPEYSKSTFVPEVSREKREVVTTFRKLLEPDCYWVSRELGFQVVLPPCSKVGKHI